MKNSDYPAFPAEIQVGDNGIEAIQTGITTFSVPGLTKREYFAAMAMQGFLSNSLVIEADPTKGMIARWAIDYADALLDELENTNQSKTQ